MSYLFDTHTLLWLLAGNRNLTARIRSILADKEPTKFVSSASIWEIAVKVSIEKLEIEYPVATLPSLIVEKGYVLLSVNHLHAVGIAALPLLHRDPFDRMLVSQALTEGFRIMTRDNLITQYNVATIW